MSTHKTHKVTRCITVPAVTLLGNDEGTLGMKTCAIVRVQRFILVSISSGKSVSCPFFGLLPLHSGLANSVFLNLEKNHRTIARQSTPPPIPTTPPAPNITRPTKQSRHLCHLREDKTLFLFPVATPFSHCLHFGKHGRFPERPACARIHRQTSP